MAMARLRGAAPVPFFERIEVVARHRRGVPLDARDRVTTQPERERRCESRYRCADDRGVRNAARRRLSNALCHGVTADEKPLCLRS